MTIQKKRSANKQRRLQKTHQDMTEKEAPRAALYVSHEQLTRKKIKRSKKPGEMTLEAFEDFSRRCAKACAEAMEKERALQLDYVGETIKARREARAEAIARNQIVEGDEVQLKEKIKGYRGRDIGPIPEWVLAEGLYGRVEQFFPADIFGPKLWKEPGSAKGELSPPHAMIVYPDLYVGFNAQSSRVQVQYIEDYDSVNKDGEVVHCNTFEECENPELDGFARDEETVLINGVVHAVLQEADCEVRIPTHWLEHKPGNQSRAAGAARLLNRL